MILSLGIIVIASIYLKLQWLTIGTVFLFLLIYMTEGSSSSKPSSSSPASSGEVLHPVVYSDEGEPPLLYGQKQEIKMYTESEKRSGIEMITGAIGNIAGTTVLIIRKLLK